MSNGASATALDAALNEEFMTPTKFSKTFGYAYSTLSVHIRRGEIALHQFSDEARPKVNVSEALQVMSKVKRAYTLPTLRVIHHDDKAESPKVDLFS